MSPPFGHHSDPWTKGRLCSQELGCGHPCFRAMRQCTRCFTASGGHVEACLSQFFTPTPARLDLFETALKQLCPPLQVSCLFACNTPPLIAGGEWAISHQASPPDYCGFTPVMRTNLIKPILNPWAIRGITRAPAAHIKDMSNFEQQTWFNPDKQPGTVHSYVLQLGGEVA